jgi:uncharacterized protein
MNTLDLLKEKRDEILDIANQYGAYDIRVFGSVVREEEHANSDIDFVVRMHPGKTLLDLIGLWQDLEVLFGGRKVDVLSEDGISPYLRDKILKEAIPL